MSELNKKLSALSRKPGRRNGMAYSDIKPATIKPVKQSNLKPWAALGVLSLGVVLGIGGWQVWHSDEPVSEVVKAVSPVATAEAASAHEAESTMAEPQSIAKVTAVESEVNLDEQLNSEAPASEVAATKVSVPKASVSKAPVPKEPLPKASATKDPLPKKVAPTKSVPKAAEVKEAEAKEPKTMPAAAKPMAAKAQPSTTDDDFQHSIDMDIADGEESLMIETVELDAGQLARIEYNKAEKALKQGDSRKAIGYLESAVKYNPEWITARQKLAALYYGRGETRRAMVSLQQGLALDSGQPDLRLTMAKLLVNESQQQAALSVLSQMPPYAHSGYLAMRGALAQQLNQNDLALSSYQNLVKAEPYDGRWWLGLGVALERGQEWEQAEEAYQQALRMGQISGETQQFIRQRLAVLAKSKG